MKLDAYGKRIEIQREKEAWVIYELGEGKRTRSNDIYIPAEYDEIQTLTRRAHCQGVWVFLQHSLNFTLHQYLMERG